MELRGGSLKDMSRRFSDVSALWLVPSVGVITYLLVTICVVFNVVICLVSLYSPFKFRKNLAFFRLHFLCVLR